MFVVPPVFLCRLSHHMIVPSYVSVNAHWLMSQVVSVTVVFASMIVKQLVHNYMHAHERHNNPFGRVRVRLFFNLLL
jgi:hypothetical protein